jgi:hypothetical protein
MLRRVCIAALLIGCSSSSPSSAPADATPQETSDAAADAPVPGPECVDPNAASTAACGTLAWSTSPLKSRLRNHHVTFVVETKSGPFLFAMGGLSGGALIANVDRSAIGGDGSLGAWSDAVPLPVTLAGHTGGALGNVVVVAGGQTAHGNTDLSYSAVVADDGTFGAWKTGPSTLEKRMHAGAFVLADSIYVLGGFDDPNVWDDAVRATVMSNGTVSPFMPAGKLRGPRSHFSLTRVGDYVYMAGGLDASALSNPPLLDEVARAKIESDGSLGEWTTMPALPVALATHASFFWGGYLYVGGGINPTTHEKRFWRAPIGADHALGTWELAAPLPIARGHVHQLPIVGNHVYSVSGAVDYNLLSTPFIAIGTFE